MPGKILRVVAPEAALQPIQPGNPQDIPVHTGRTCTTGHCDTHPMTITLELGGPVEPRLAMSLVSSQSYDKRIQRSSVKCGFLVADRASTSAVKP